MQRTKPGEEMISVIVPVYNIQDFVRTCIESICRQEYENLEIILVDDGSTDESSCICDEYAEKDGRIQVIHKQNGGLVEARKDGLRVAKGRYIAYVDGDDWIEPDMMKVMFATLKEQSVDIVMCGHYENTGDAQREVYHGISEGRYDREELEKKIFPYMIANGSFFEWGIFPGMWDKLFRREALEQFQMEVDNHLTIGEDAACVYPCMLNAHSICILNRCFYHYRQTMDSMIKQSLDGAVERLRFRTLYRFVKGQFRKYPFWYNLSEQWKEFILFLMTPRAGYLYEGMEKKDFLFPFPKVKKGSRIIIYGMGTYGQLLYKFLLETGFCKIMATVDKNYTELRKQGLDVKEPGVIYDVEYDAIVIAISFAKVRNAVYQDLTLKLPKDKIHQMSEELIKSNETLYAFGLARDN